MIDQARRVWLMTVSLRTRRRLFVWLVSIALGGVAGVFYMFAILPPDHSNAVSWLTGARAGMSIAAATSALEIFVIYGTSGAALRRLPFLRLLGLRVTAHAAIITLLLVLNAFI